MGFDSLREIFFQLQDSCLADCKILQDKTQFCRTVLYVNITKNVVIFVRHLSDKIKYFVSQNEILLVLTDRPALFVKTGFERNPSKSATDNLYISTNKISYTVLQQLTKLKRMSCGNVTCSRLQV